MANMFSGHTEKKIPKDLESCYKLDAQDDAVTYNLWRWSEATEKIGKILFWFIVISGIAIAIYTSISTVEVTKGTYYTYTKTETKFDVELFITALLDTARYALIEYFAYHVIALLIASLATIVQHTKITANIALYNAAKTYNIDEVENTTDDMTDVEEVNEQENTEPVEQKKMFEEVIPTEKWVCQKCGASNSKHSMCCSTCGEYK